MRIGLIVALAFLGAVPFSFGAARADDAALTARVQQVLDAYVKDRASIEGFSGVALQVDRGGGRPIISVYAGDNGLSGKKPIGPDTLFDIGSNTKEFTSALILKLEAAGKLRLDDTIGKWLPQYPAWKDVTIRALLQMTSPIPNYSETVAIGEIEVADLHHQFSGKDLIGFVDPANGNHFPPGAGWFYSNTNYILAGLIIEAASGMNYEQALTTMILEPLGLHDTYYADGPHPGPASAGPVMSRVPRALYMLQDCLGYQPEPCKVSTLAPLIGKDMRMQNRSWAGEAGAIISNPHDLGLWIRALFEKRVVPAKQLDEMTTLVSNKTGRPLQEVSADEPVGFGLGLGRFFRKELGGAYWFYEGETLGFRTIFAYWPQDDLLITGSVNSRPPNGEDQFGPAVIGGAFMALQQEGAVKPATK
ncbi:MAG TPA: serine hydrolase domain-containing protein [Roseiarcus sp.]|jgi:D-alanyl-D-alanine carboxypeptidase